MFIIILIYLYKECIGTGVHGESFDATKYCKIISALQCYSQSQQSFPVIHKVGNVVNFVLLRNEG